MDNVLVETLLVQFDPSHEILRMNTLLIIHRCLMQVENAKMETEEKQKTADQQLVEAHADRDKMRLTHESELHKLEEEKAVEIEQLQLSIRVRPCHSVCVSTLSWA